MGIYVADRVAGGFTTPHKTISAIRIAAQSKVTIEEEDGTPFIGSVARRASEYSMKQYFMERDGYRELQGDFFKKKPWWVSRFFHWLMEVWPFSSNFEFLGGNLN